MDALRAEYSEYQRMLRDEGPPGHHGSGDRWHGGKGSTTSTSPEYQDQFKEKLGFTPFEEALNLKIVPSDQSKMDMLRRIEGITISGFHCNGRTFGEVKAYPATHAQRGVRGHHAVRSHYSEVMEVLCKVQPRAGPWG